MPAVSTMNAARVACMSCEVREVAFCFIFLCVKFCLGVNHVTPARGKLHYGVCQHNKRAHKYVLFLIKMGYIKFHLQRKPGKFDAPTDAVTFLEFDVASGPFWVDGI